MKQPENHEHLNMLDSALKLLQNHETLSWISLILFIRIGSWTTGTRRFQVSAKRRPEISSWRWFSWECPSVDLLRSSSSAMATLGATTPVPSASGHHTLAAVHQEHLLPLPTWPMSTSSPSVAGSSPFSTAFRTCPSMCHTFWLSSNVTWPSAIHPLINNWTINEL